MMHEPINESPVGWESPNREQIGGSTELQRNTMIGTKDNHIVGYVISHRSIIECVIPDE